MIIESHVQQQLKAIWDSYVSQGKKTYDTKGRKFEDIDQNRLAAIRDIKKIIGDFQEGKLGLPEFKTNLDSYNKQNNYWGFTAAKGQMFFNLLTKSSVGNIENYIALLKDVIREPSSLDVALAKMKQLFEYVSRINQQAPDKRFVANPKSSAYFLSYFWQIHNHKEWPVMYSSIIVSFEKLEIWHPFPTAHENYKNFFELNESVKSILSAYTSSKISNWDAEHALWNYAGTVTINSKTPLPKKSRKELSVSKGIEPVTPANDVNEELPVLQARFDLLDYLVPKIAKLYELGASTDKSSGAKGKEFEKLVGEAFKFLDFDVDVLGQGTGREPDAIAKYREDHIAFIVDAKAYANGYTVGTDDRAIREYINHYCPRLKKEGFTKIGFIIVSNSFKSDFKDTKDSITWTTDIKRFLLLTTKALQYLVAYKTKDKLSITDIVEKLISFDKPITEEMIIERFEDY